MGGLHLLFILWITTNAGLVKATRSSTFAPDHLAKSTATPIGKDYINATHRNIDGMIIDITSPMEFLNDTHVLISGEELDVNKVFPNFYNLSANGEHKNSIRKIEGDIDEETFKKTEFNTKFNHSKDFINTTHRMIDGMIVNLNETYDFINSTHLNVTGMPIEVNRIYPMFPKIKTSPDDSKGHNTRILAKKTSRPSIVSIKKKCNQMMAWYKQNIYNQICGYQCLTPCVGMSCNGGGMGLGLAVIPVVGMMGSGMMGTGGAPCVGAGCAGNNYGGMQPSFPVQGGNGHNSGGMQPSFPVPGDYEESNKPQIPGFCRPCKNCKSCPKRKPVKCPKKKPCVVIPPRCPIPLPCPIPRPCPPQQMCPIPRPCPMLECPIPPPCPMPVPCPRPPACERPRPCRTCTRCPPVQICPEQTPCIQLPCPETQPQICPPRFPCPAPMPCPAPRPCPLPCYNRPFKCPRPKPSRVCIPKKKKIIIQEIDIEMDYPESTWTEVGGSVQSGGWDQSSYPLPWGSSASCSWGETCKSCYLMKKCVCKCKNECILQQGTDIKMLEKERKRLRAAIQPSLSGGPLAMNTNTTGMVDNATSSSMPITEKVSVNLTTTMMPNGNVTRSVHLHTSKRG